MTQKNLNCSLLDSLKDFGMSALLKAPKETSNFSAALKEIKRLLMKSVHSFLDIKKQVLLSYCMLKAQIIYHYQFNSGFTQDFLTD